MSELPSSELWCLKIVVAYPDYKRPFAGVSVKHYKSKEKAEVELRRRKEEFMSGWEDDEEESEDEELTDEEEEERFNEKFERYLGLYYEDRCYMDMPAFEGEIFLAKDEE